MSGPAKHSKVGERACAASKAAQLAYRRAWRTKNRDHENAKKRAARAGLSHPGLWIQGEEVSLPEVDPL